MFSARFVTCVATTKLNSAIAMKAEATAKITAAILGTECFRRKETIGARVNVRRRAKANGTKIS
ncbi:hypothetical protein D3C71_2056570 [compost metagenome]